MQKQLLHLLAGSLLASSSTPDERDTSSAAVGGRDRSILVYLRGRPKSNDIVRTNPAVWGMSAVTGDLSNDLQCPRDPQIVFITLKSHLLEPSYCPHFGAGALKIRHFIVAGFTL